MWAFFKHESEELRGSDMMYDLLVSWEGLSGLSNASEIESVIKLLGWRVGE